MRSCLVSRLIETDTIIIDLEDCDASEDQQDGRMSRELELLVRLARHTSSVLGGLWTL